MRPKIITQSSTPTPWIVVQGAYSGLWPDSTPQWQHEIGWDCENQPTPAQYQLEFFIDACVDKSAIFRQLVTEWRTERGASSSTTEILLSRAYQSIIGMGEIAVPLILSEMESEGDDPDQWFFALQVLTGANPVAEADDGDFQAMAKAWFAWARRRYIW